MHIWGVSGVTFRVIAQYSASAFSIVVDLRHFPRTMVFDTVRISVGKHREHGRIESAWENLIRIKESHGNVRTPMRI